MGAVIMGALVFVVKIGGCDSEESWLSHNTSTGLLPMWSLLSLHALEED